MFVHHHLRDAADEDLTHVRGICELFHVPLHVEHVYPANQPGNIAANARAQRYDAMLNVARRVNADYVAVAHHGDDQLETMVMMLCRGAGLDGLSAMPWRRSIAPGQRVQLIRPLLDARKVDCQSLCDVAGLSWREDASNVDRSRSRARLRAEVLPVLESLWPDAARRAAATADALHLANSMLQERVEHVFGHGEQRQWPRDALRTQPIALIAAGLLRTVAALVNDCNDTTQRHLLAVAEAVRDDERRPRSFDLGGNARAWVTASELRVELI